VSGLRFGRSNPGFSSGKEKQTSRSDLGPPHRSAEGEEKRGGRKVFDRFSRRSRKGGEGTSHAAFATQDVIEKRGGVKKEALLEPHSSYAPEGGGVVTLSVTSAQKVLRELREGEKKRWRIWL